MLTRAFAEYSLSPSGHISTLRHILECGEKKQLTAKTPTEMPTDITEEMKLSAARAIASIVSDDELKEDYIIPGAFDPRVAEAVANAVAKAARETGVARL